MLGPTLILILLIAADTIVNTVHASFDIENLVRTLQQLQQQQENELLTQVPDEIVDSSDSSHESLTFGSLNPEQVENLIQAAVKDAEPDKTKHAKSLKSPVVKQSDTSSDINLPSLLNLISNRADDDDNSKEVYLPFIQAVKYAEPDKTKHVKGLKSPVVKQSDTSNDINLSSLLNLISNQADDDDKSKEEVYLQLEPERKKQSKQASINSYLDQITKLLPETKSVRQKPRKKQLQPNNLLGDAFYSEAVNKAEQRSVDLNDYSKVYVILNVDAIQQTKTRNRLTDLVYSLLKNPSGPNKDHREQKRGSRYKGFLLKDVYRRGGKGKYSDEADNMDRNPSPKRLRSRDSGAGGRTPIPYIRNRGDIYEKDN